MATLTIRNVDPDLQQRLRLRAAQHGHSMEAELRQILKDVLRGDPAEQELNLVESIRRIVEPLGGIELEISPREPMGPPIEFKE